MKSKQKKCTHSKIRFLRKRIVLSENVALQSRLVAFWSFPVELWEVTWKEAESIKTRQETNWGFLNLFLSSKKEKHLHKLYKIEGILLPELRRNKG